MIAQYELDAVRRARRRFKVELEDGEAYVLKRCKDYGEAEILTNSRLMRACPNSIASYCGAFYGPKEGKSTPKSGSIWKRAQRAALGSNEEEEEDPLWIVWKFEGTETLAALMENKDFPYNVEPFLFKGSGGIAIENEPRGASSARTTCSARRCSEC